MRVMPAASYKGFSATTIWIVEQLGLAMMPRWAWSAILSALTSGTTNGISSSIRKWLVLSMTTAPASTAAWAYRALTDEPAENSAMSMSSKESSSSTFTGICRPPNASRWPADRSEASNRRVSTGNSRSARIFRISSPTAPVAPTTATLYLSLFMSR